jgi:hypothetical protein
VTGNSQEIVDLLADIKNLDHVALVSRHAWASRQRPKNDGCQTVKIFNLENGPYRCLLFWGGLGCKRRSPSSHPHKQRSSSGIAAEATEFGMSF